MSVVRARIAHANPVGVSPEKLEAQLALTDLNDVTITNGAAANETGKVALPVALDPDAMDGVATRPHWRIRPPSHDGNATYPLSFRLMPNPARNFFGVTATLSSEPASISACVPMRSVPRNTSVALASAERRAWNTRSGVIALVLSAAPIVAGSASACVARRTRP